MSEFGYHGTGTNDSGASDPILTKMPATSEAGTLTGIGIYCRTYGSSVNFHVAIYADNAGSPAARLAESSSAVAITGTTDFINTYISYALESGKVYWLGYWLSAGSAVGIAYETGAADQRKSGTDSGYPTFPNPWSGEVWSLTLRSQIWGVYTPASSATPINVTDISDSVSASDGISGRFNFRANIGDDLLA